MSIGRITSAVSWRGLPLYDIGVGQPAGLGDETPVMRGVIAIGFRARGVLAIGVQAQGIVSIGLLSVGVFSVGVLSLGLISLGVCAAAFGAAAGVAAVAPFALGVVAAGYWVGGVSAMGPEVLFSVEQSFRQTPHKRQLPFPIFGIVFIGWGAVIAASLLGLRQKQCARWRAESVTALTPSEMRGLRRSIVRSMVLAPILAVAAIYILFLENVEKHFSDSIFGLLYLTVMLSIPLFLFFAFRCPRCKFHYMLTSRHPLIPNCCPRCKVAFKPDSAT